MQDIQIINNDSQVQFYKKLWKDSEIILARCFNFVVDVEAGTITATICITSRKALYEFIRAAYKNFSESLSEESRRNMFYEHLDTIYGSYNANAMMQAQPKLPYYDKLYQHQKDVLNDVFYKKHNFLALDMGLGKSLLSASISRVHQIKRTVVMCPAAVKWNWMDDLVKFGFNQMYFSILDASKNRTFKTNFGERFLIVNYDVIKQFEDHICGQDVGHFILDESQKIKNPSSIRSKNVKTILDKFPNARITFLSGTPISNRVNDIFNYLKMIGHELGHNHKRFLEEFTIRATGKGGERVTGGKNLQDLHVKLSNFMIRKTKEECLDLPDKIFMSYKFELDDYMEAYNEIIKEMSQNRKMSSLTGNIHSLNLITAKAKRQGIIDLAEMIIEDGRKVVIFGGYKDPLNDLAEYFGDKCVKIDGSVESFTRNELVKKFSDPEGPPVFLGNWDAAGVGINLVSASDFIVQSFPFTPAQFNQGVDRLNRIGQTKAVNVHLTFCDGSVDEHIYNLIVDKQIDINAVIDIGSEVMLRENIMEVLIKKLLKRDDINLEYDFSSNKDQNQGKTFTPVDGGKVEVTQTIPGRSVFVPNPIFYPDKTEPIPDRERSYGSGQLEPGQSTVGGNLYGNNDPGRVHEEVPFKPEGGGVFNNFSGVSEIVELSEIVEKASSGPQKFELPPAPTFI